jgi:(p)ppGpp synthase/HD superfamily hydrolase
MNQSLISMAFDFAQRIHANETKKLTNRPYLFHPMGVASLVLQFGGSEEQACAALLHDTIASVTQDEISNLFGEKICELTYSFSDPIGFEHASWKEQKMAYIQKLKTLNQDALLVIFCEEFHDLNSLHFELKQFGEEIWDRYPVSPNEVVWYYRELLRLFQLKFNDFTPLEEYEVAFANLMNLIQ